MYENKDEENKQKPENINDVVLTPLPSGSKTQKKDSALTQMSPRTATRELYFRFNDREAQTCQYNGGMSFTQAGVDFCTKPHCKCAYQNNYKQDDVKKICKYKPK